MNRGLAAAGVACALLAGGAAAPVQAKPRRCVISATLVPSCGVWWGVAAGAFTARARHLALTDFERKIGRRVDIYHHYHRAFDTFPTAQEIAVAKNRMLFLNWRTDQPYTWAEIARGALDRRIDALAGRLRTMFPHRFFLTVHHEPENDVVPDPGSGYTAGDYRRMFRHVILRLRGQGAWNVVSVMSYMGYPNWGTRPWFHELYPGDDVVDWVAYDPYTQPGVVTFRQLVNRTKVAYPGWPGFYDWAVRRFPAKPLMLGEWGVFDAPDLPGRKARIFHEAAAALSRYPRLKALVYFDTPNAPKGDTRIDSTPDALSAFRSLSRHPYVNVPHR